jgi:hypothetical protein
VSRKEFDALVARVVALENPYNFGEPRRWEIEKLLEDVRRRNTLLPGVTMLYGVGR